MQIRHLGPQRFEKKAQPSRYTEWWFHLTSTTTPIPAGASFMQREMVRRSHLLSIIVFFLMLIVIIILPATFFIPSHWTTLFLGGVLLVSIISLGLNRAGKVLVSGWVTVILVEGAMISIILTTVPFDTFNLPLYDLFIVMELLTVSLLPARIVFGVAGCNVLFIFMDLKFQTHTTALSHTLTTQFYNALIRPAALQIIVAGVSYLWVHGTLKAFQQANHAEEIARLEHEVAEKARSIEEKRLELQAGLQRLTQWHSSAARGDYVDIPSLPNPIFWPLMSTIKLTLSRLRRLANAERDLQLLLYAIATSAHLLETNVPTEDLPRTGTPFDQIVFVLHHRQRPKPDARSDGEHTNHQGTTH